MTKEEKVRWLQRYLSLEKELALKREDLLRWKAEAERMTASLSDIPKGQSVIHDRMAETVANITDHMNDISSHIDTLLAVKKEIEAEIHSVENGTCRLLLLLRYIEGKKWENIAVTMNYSWRAVHMIHQKALKMILNREEMEKSMHKNAL